MLEDSNGEYKQSSTSTFPGYEYFYNQSKSGCMNNSGKQIKDSLLYDQDNKKATVNVSETSMCYLYFDKYKSTSFSDELIASNTLWQSNLEGDGYRFTGSGNATASTSPNNFICFGTTDKDTCTSNPSTYMYRIIGVFADENGDNHVKLIKYTQLSSKYAWNSISADVDWANSTLYAGLNGSYFLTNTTYSYMQDNTWLNKITDWKWSAVNTKTYEDKTNNPNYYESSPTGIYLSEMNKGSSSNTLCTNYNSTAVNCLGGSWTTPTAKIGLMYASDYALSLGQTALSMTTGTYTNRDTLKTGWMHQSNNDTSADTYERTISRCGGYSSRWYAWSVCADGRVDGTDVAYAYGSRAVFYLESYVSKSSGSGSLSDPYIIGTPSGNPSVSLSNSGSTLNATITKGTGNLNKYCINTSSSITNCTWNNITSTSITYTMPDYGTYYVHVIDDAGYIAHSSLTYTPVPLVTTLINSGNLWQSGLEGDGYRFTGSGNATASTSPKNFICFGTTDKDTCTSNPSTYMYRIIGVFADENGDNHVKLIKYTQLPTAYAWHSSHTDVDWADSDLYKGLNGSYFLTNTTYSYMQDNTWLNKITDWKWSAVNTKSIEDPTNNPDYSYTTGKGIYLHEMNKGTSSDTSCTNINQTAINCLGGSWTTPTAKIGLMYASDYALSLGQAALSYNSDSNYSTLKTGWMHQSNNDTTASEYEWTISRVGASGSPFFAWYVTSDGNLNYYSVTDTYGASPVLYLESDISGSGEGTLENPIMLN